MFAGGGDHQQAQAGPGQFRVDAFDDGQRVRDIGAAPAEAGIGDLEVAAGGGAAAADADAGGAHAEKLAGLVFGEHAGDVVIDDDHLIGMAEPLAGENADGGTAAADAHAGFGRAIDHRGGAGLDAHGGTTVDGEIHRRTVGEGEQGVAGGGPFLLGAAGEVMHPAEAEHLAAIFGGGDVADLFAAGAHGGGFRAEMAVGIDFHLQAAIGENTLRDHGDHVHAVDVGADDEGGGFIVRVGGAGADAGGEDVAGGERVGGPVGAGEADLIGAADQHGQRVHAGEAVIDIAVAVAGAGFARADAAEHRAGIAQHDSVCRAVDFGQGGFGRTVGAGMGRGHAVGSVS